MKSIYTIKGDQVYDILTAGMNSVYSDEMDDPDSDQLLFELKNDFINKLYDFENLLTEFKQDLIEEQNTNEAITSALNVDSKYYKKLF